jgi:hypothetical protein
MAKKSAASKMQRRGPGVGKSLGKRRLDTARLPTQTKNSIFKRIQQMAGVKGKSGGHSKAARLVQQETLGLKPGVFYSTGGGSKV